MVKFHQVLFCWFELKAIVEKTEGFDVSCSSGDLNSEVLCFCWLSYGSDCPLELLAKFL